MGNHPNRSKLSWKQRYEIQGAEYKLARHRLMALANQNLELCEALDQMLHDYAADGPGGFMISGETIERARRALAEARRVA